MQQSSLNKTLQIDTEKLPSIPQALLKLLEIISDPDVELLQISQIIQSDPALTARILSVANSGAYCQWNEFKDFHRLVVVLGLDMVKTITINSAVQQFFSQFNVDDKGLLANFWKTSLTAACIARNLAHITGYTNKDEAYIAGLLHKTGELICFMHNAEDYQRQSKNLQSRFQGDSLAVLEEQRSIMEKEFIGSDIPEIGAWIIQQFDQKTLLGDAILYQREPVEKLSGAPRLVQLINLAHKLSEPSINKELADTEVSSMFDLSQALLEDLMEKSRAEVEVTAKSLGIKIKDDNIIETDNEAVQIKLAENVRAIALSSSLQQICAHRSEKELIERIMQNLKVLFGLTKCIYLEFNQQSNGLQAQYGMNVEMEQLEPFHIPMDASVTLPIKSLLRAVPIFSNDAQENSKKSVLDRQLRRLLNSKELLCIPLLESLFDRHSMSKEKYGVLVVGVSANNFQSLKREKGLLYEFSRSASEVIFRDKTTAQRIKSVIEEEQSQQSLTIRKLVHEANNPLGVIRNYLQILSQKLKDYEDEKLQGQLEILMEEVERVGNIVLRIRETPEHSSISNNQVNINELINRLLSIFQDSLFIKAGINTIVNLDAAIPIIQSNANSVKQILTNLLKNAVEAMPDGGEIQITTRDQINFNGEQFIELCITDNGPGIPEVIMKNLFNPVQSTKSKKHSGLGLSIIKNLINDLGGTIRGSNRHAGHVSVNLDQKEITGAEFIILLPRKLNQNES